MQPRNPDHRAVRGPTRRRRVGAIGLLTLALVTASAGVAPPAQADHQMPDGSTWEENPRGPIVPIPDTHRPPPSRSWLSEDERRVPQGNPVIGPGYVLPGVDEGVENPTPATRDPKHGSDCDPCVRNMHEQLFGANSLTAKRIAREFRVPRPNDGLTYDFVKMHNQGVGLLRDTVINGKTFSRIALSYNDNQEGGGLMIAAHEGRGPGDDTGGGRLDYGADTSEEARGGRNAIHVDITKNPLFGNHAHPGGLATQGDMVAIAMEQPEGPDHRAGVYFMRVNGATPEYVGTAWLGGQPDGVELNLTSAASVGFTRRAMGGFVMAISGEKHGTDGIWWYVTDDAEITGTTTWKYVDFWDPQVEMPNKLCNTKSGSHGNDCFVGAGGGMSLVTGCDGKLYLVVMTGTDGGGRDDEYAQVLEVSQETVPLAWWEEEDLLAGHQPRPRHEVKLKSIWSTHHDVGIVAAWNISYRWTGGANVLRDGSIAMLSTERRGLMVGRVGWVDGYIRIGGRNTVKP